MDITKPLNDVDVALLKPKFHEALDILYDHLLHEVNLQFKVYCQTFEHPRKVYADDREWHTLTLAHMKALLNAGESGEDEGGAFQVFSLSNYGHQLLEWD